MRPGGSGRGQVLIMFALALAILLAFAGLAIDVGRLVAERRHVQNAADAGALAICQKLVDGGSDADAMQAGREVALLNLAGSPAGATATIASAGSEQYEDGQPSQPAYLSSGVLIETETEVVGTSVTVRKLGRVAIDSTVGTTLGRAVGVTSMKTGARARCGMEGGPTVPIVARRYVHSPGPNAPDCPAEIGQNTFVDFLATAATSTCYVVDETNVIGYGGRTPASEAAPGPVFSLYGPDSMASNDSSFRGFIAVDIRNFASDISRRYYNGVTAGTNANTIKQKEGEYILARYYPGPPFPPVVTPPDPNGQVAVLRGNDTAMVVGNFEDVYRVGDRMVLATYSGTVKSIPDFSISPPARIDLPATQSTPIDGPTFTVSRNDSFAGTVELHLHGDTNAPSTADDIVDAAAGNGAPATGKINQPTYNPAAGPTDGFIPSRRGTTVTMKGFRTNAVPAGIYTAWLEGHSSSPYSTTRRQPVPVRIGGAVRDFSLANSVTSGQTDTLGGSIALNLYVSTAKTSNAANWGSTSSAVTLSVDTATLPPGMTVAPTFSTTSLVPTVPSGNNLGANSVLTINTSGLAAGSYEFMARARGTNGASQPVTHLLRITFSVVSAPSGGSYVDVIGFAAFEVTAITANGIEGRAISSVAASADDWALHRAHRARLLPWNN